MTNEQPAYVPAEYDYIQIGIPGLDYSKAFLAWNSDFAQAAKILRELRDAIHAEFYTEPNAAALAPAQPLPRPSSAAPAQGRPSQAGVTFKCPEHGDELRPSVRNKTMDYVEELGMELPASWFHSGPDGRTCSVYLSRLRPQLEGAAASP